MLVTFFFNIEIYIYFLRCWDWGEILSEKSESRSSLHFKTKLSQVERRGADSSLGG